MICGHTSRTSTSEMQVQPFFRHSCRIVLSLAGCFICSTWAPSQVKVEQNPISCTLLFSPGRFLKSIRKQFQDKLAHANSTADEAIANMATVRSFSSEGKMNKMYSTDINASYFLGRKLAFLSGGLGW